MQKRFEPITGMKGFLVVWLGQIISVLTSSMSAFGLSIWMFEKTQSATAMALMQVFFITPFLLMSPIAGVMVDRYNRKLMMAVSDACSFVATAAILILFATGNMQTWHLYIAEIIYGVGNTFQWPAYSAAISTMVPKEQLGRANGLMALLEGGPGVVAPMLAGAMLPVVGLTGILGLDVATFILALGALLLISVPKPAVSAEGSKEQGNLLQQSMFGFKYIFKRPSLLALQGLLLGVNLFFGIGFAVLSPMVLSRTGNDSIIYGTVQSAQAIGAVVGGIIMSAWGGFKKRVNGFLLGMVIPGLFGMTFFGLGQGLPVWIPAAVMMSIAGPLCNGSNQAIWQSKVPQDLQGRVFSARRMIAWLTTPIAPIIGGTLADYVLEPAMKTNTFLAQTFGPLVGTGVGSGMGLLMVICGLIATVVALSGFFMPVVRNVETLLPDLGVQKDTDAERYPGMEVEF
ncbi:MAG TPA: MFS transporter [Anaerolineaceae bacterium]|jgi:MFS family permease|nr:MFS transporter [Anaerolineaceae bacterium]